MLSFKKTLLLLLTQLLWVVPALSYNDGDVNNDGAVNTADIATVVDVITGVTPDSIFPKADVNGDSVVDGSDISMLVGYITGEIVPTVDTTETIDTVTPVQPTVPETSMAIFGTSKSATHTFKKADGWIGILLDSLLTRDGYVSRFTTTGSVSIGYKTERRFASRVSHCIKGVGSTMSFDIKGRFLVLSQVIAPVHDYATVAVYCDSVLIDTIVNRNPTVQGERTLQLEGNGTQRSFSLPDLESHSYSVSIDSVPCSLSTDQRNLTDGHDCYILRCVDTRTGNLRRILYFPTPPTGHIQVTYKTGDLIAFSHADYYCTDTLQHEETWGGINPVTDSNATVTYAGSNPLLPVVTDDRAITCLDLGSDTTHHIQLVITGGEGKPYFDLDFATTRRYRVLNAAFGSWTLGLLYNESGWRDYRAMRFIDSPDIVIVEHGANEESDDIDLVPVTTDTLTLAELKTGYRKMKTVKTIATTSDNRLAVTWCTGTIDSIGEYALRSRDIIGSSIAVGDYLRIGEYHSSWHEFVVRRVASVDHENGVITWEDAPFSPDSIWHYTSYEQMQGAQFAVRRLDTYKAQLSRAITRLRWKAPSARYYLLGASTYHDNYYCTGWAYDEAVADVAAACNATPINVWRNLMQCDETAPLVKTSIAIDADSLTTFTIPASSVTNQWRNFRVFLNGEDVTGTRALVHSNVGYHVNSNATLSNVTLASNQGWWRTLKFTTIETAVPLTIQFYGPAPLATDTLQLATSKYAWTTDGLHQNTYGNASFALSLLQGVSF